ncbi:MAG TPA: hypothetical protein VGJ78_07645 [Vicinamibacterales bacterium]|jgi:hypothetical protein
MPMDHNQGRRGHFHRGGRRGPDRRGPERRQVPLPDQASRAERNDRVDVEQIMREIRARIAQRSGVDLSNQQIQELAARRLEAILDPRGLKPELLDQLRRAAGERTVPVDAAPPAAAQSYPFDEATLYDSPNGFLRFLRKLFNPLLRLLFNPTPIAHALAQQSRLNTDLLQREAERDRRQAEWNALHYELLQRLALDASRVSVESQSLSMRVESLGTKVDFNERRVRTMEGAQARPSRPQESSQAAQQTAAPSVPASEVAPQPPAEGQPAGETSRRRRRRRRGRRGPGAGVPADAAVNAPAATASVVDMDEGDGEGDEGFEEEAPEPVTPRPEPVALDHQLPAATEHREEPAAEPEPIRTEEPSHTPEE